MTSPPKKVEVLRSSPSTAFQEPREAPESMCLVEVTAGTLEEGAQEDRASRRIRSLGASGAWDASPLQPQRQGEC